MLRLDFLWESMQTDEQYQMQSFPEQDEVIPLGDDFMPSYGEDNQRNFDNDNNISFKGREESSDDSTQFMTLPSWLQFNPLPVAQHERICQRKTSEFSAPPSSVVIDHHPDAPLKSIDFPQDSKSFGTKGLESALEPFQASQEKANTEGYKPEAKWTVGDTVKAQYEDLHFYEATIVEVLIEDEEVRYKIAWDDGADHDLWKQESQVRDFMIESEEESAEDQLTVYCPDASLREPSPDNLSDNDSVSIAKSMNRKNSRKGKTKKKKNKRKRSGEKKRTGTKKRKTKHALQRRDNYDELLQEQTKWKFGGVQSIRSDARHKFCSNINQTRCEIDSQSSLVVLFVMNEKINELKRANEHCRYKCPFDKALTVKGNFRDVPFALVQFDEFHALSLTKRWVDRNFYSSLIMTTEDVEVETADGSMKTIPQYSFLTGICDVGDGATEMSAVSLGVGSQRKMKRKVTKYDAISGRFAEPYVDSFKKVETNMGSFVHSYTPREVIRIIRKSTGLVQLRFRRVADHVTCGNHTRKSTITPFSDLLKERLRDNNLVQHINAGQLL